jgi:hypothetical protein
VLHLPVNHASQMRLLVEGLRKCGVDARGVVDSSSSMHDSEGLRVVASRSSNNRLLQEMRRMPFYAQVAREIARADIVHWHSRHGIPRQADMALADRLGKVCIVEFHGTEARTVDGANPYLKAIHEDPDNPYRVRADAEQHQYRMGRYAPTAIVPVDLLPQIRDDAFERVLVRPGVVDTSTISSTPPAADLASVRFFHAASSTVKATDAVLQSLSDLQGRYRFTVDIAQQVPRTDVLRRMQAADVYLDQFALGTYGIAAIEAMAMGKPVVGYVTPEIREMLPGSVPLVSSTQEHLSETLSELLTAPQRLRHLGEASREYAQNHHDARTVAEALADVYRALTDGREPDRWTLWNT